MQILSSDTNIWLDFNAIGSLSLPFTLSDKYQYIISTDTLSDEILSPPNLADSLIKAGLVAVEINEAEFQTSIEFMKYSSLSFYDRLALSIAKQRNIILLTGDGNLRKAALKEGIVVHGTLWLLDEVLKANKVEVKEYARILRAILSCPSVRQPKQEIEKRLMMVAASTR